MGGLLSNISAILAQSQQRVDVAAQNISNMTTPGYRRRVAFTEMLSRDARDGEIVEFRAGNLKESGAPLDIAILNDGFFVVRSPTGLAYTRHGAFVRGPGGEMQTPDGYVLQLENAGDLVLSGGALKIEADGFVIDDGRPLGRIQLARFDDPRAALRREGSVFVALDDTTPLPATARVQQGAIESSNVSASEEMLALTAALRRAEAGQRLMITYDSMLGRVMSMLGASS